MLDLYGILGVRNFVNGRYGLSLCVRLLSEQS